ncbi:MAG: tRNA pseudouridine(55) synthase TruB [Chitinophagaceae bacterium]
MKDKAITQFQEGQLLLINKPMHWTSFDIVRKLNFLSRAKVGHAGTLDPLATGLLICCTGKWTKRIPHYQGMVKEYTGSFTLGAITPTFDLESIPEQFQDTSSIVLEQVMEAARRLTGAQQQVPPAHSALKRHGAPSYKLARQGLKIVPDPRFITIYDFQITGYFNPLVHFRVECSTGTYIRSLAHDFGALLGCGAHLSALCRTRIGEFSLGQAQEIGEAELMIRQLRQDQKG